MYRRLYEQDIYKTRNRKKYERERAAKDLHGKDNSKHQKNKMLADLRKKEVQGNE